MAKLFNARIAVFATFLAAGSAPVLGASLPDGESRGTVETLCSACHTVDRISESLGCSRNGWLALTDTMIDLSDSPERQEEHEGQVLPRASGRKGKT